MSEHRVIYCHEHDVYLTPGTEASDHVQANKPCTLSYRTKVD